MEMKLFRRFMKLIGNACFNAYNHHYGTKCINRRFNKIESFHTKAYIYYDKKKFIRYKICIMTYYFLTRFDHCVVGKIFDICISIWTYIEYEL
jgi:hypothetical protein